jgi:hypothetical protein
MRRKGAGALFGQVLEAEQIERLGVTGKLAQTLAAVVITWSNASRTHRLRGVHLGVQVGGGGTTSIGDECSQCSVTRGAQRVAPHDPTRHRS